MHVVNKAMELPEGASLSDNDDKNELDLNDPHRALGSISLEDDFYNLPTPLSESSRNKEKSQNMMNHEKETEDLIGDIKKTKKAKKHKHKQRKEQDVDLLDVGATSVLDSLKSEVKVKKSKKKSSKKDDVEKRKVKKEKQLID